MPLLLSGASISAVGAGRVEIFIVMLLTSDDMDELLYAEDDDAGVTVAIALLLGLVV